jgi:hypothetical protein
MIRQLAKQRAAKAGDHRYGPGYSIGATYYDARDEAIRRGDRTIGTEHLLLAMLIDPASPAAQALRCDLDTARGALDTLDDQALAAIGIQPGITAGPVAVGQAGRLRLTPAAKAIFTGAEDTRKIRGPGLGSVLSALLDLPPRSRGRTPRRAGSGCPHSAGALRRTRPGRPAMSVTPAPEPAGSVTSANGTTIGYRQVGEGPGAGNA